MALLSLPATDKTPLVKLDPTLGTLEIIGCSIHENADKFYTEVFDHVEAYVKTPAQRTMVRIALEYFNSSSAKYLLDILKRLDDLHASKASKVSLEWTFDEGDLDMEEAGNDYKGLLEMPVTIRERRNGAQG